MNKCTVSTTQILHITPKLIANKLFTKYDCTPTNQILSYAPPMKRKIKFLASDGWAPKYRVKIGYLHYPLSFSCPAKTMRNKQS